jgi:hypothetical protein
MPFQSEKQRRYMHANLPEIAKRWERDYASGGIARLGFYNGNTVAPFPLPNDLGNPLNDYRVPGEEFESQIPMGTDTIGMNEMFSYAKPESIYAPYGMGPKGNPYQNPRTIGQQVYAASDPYGNKQMDLEKENFYQQPAWYQRMFNKAGQGITGLKNKFRGGWDQSQNFVKNIMDNTLIGRLAAGFDATNPNAFNYNPLLQGQIDFLKGQDQYGVMDSSGLDKITSGVLAGKNLQSMFGSNNLMSMYDKELARASKVLGNLPNQWSKLKKNNPDEYNKKVAWYKNKIAKIQAEKNAAAAAAKAAADQRIAAERNFVTQGLGVTEADAATSGRGMDHTRGMTSRERGKAASRMGGGSRQAKSGSQKAGGSGRTDKGWGWSQGGIADLWPR